MRLNKRTNEILLTFVKECVRNNDVLTIGTPFSIEVAEKNNGLSDITFSIWFSFTDTDSDKEHFQTKHVLKNIAVSENMTTNDLINMLSKDVLKNTFVCFENHTIDINDAPAVVLDGEYSRQNMVGTEIKEDTGYFLCEIIDQNTSKEDILKRVKLGVTHQHACSIEFTAGYDFDDLAELSKSELLGIIVNVTAIDNNIPF